MAANQIRAIARLRKWRLTLEGVLTTNMSPLWGFPFVATKMEAQRVADGWREWRPLKEFLLASRSGLYPQLLKSKFRRHSPLRGAVEVTLHDQVRLIDFFNCVRFLAHGHGEGIDPHGSAAKFDDNGFQNAFVHFVQAVLVDFQHRQRLIGDRRGNF